MDVREKLVEIIQNSVGGCARNWAEIIADGLIAHGVTVQEWISVKDRLPESGKDAVLIALRWGAVDIGWCEEGRWGSEFVNEYDDGEVTHWMPLPQPPKGECKTMNCKHEFVYDEQIGEAVCRKCGYVITKEDKRKALENAMNLLRADECEPPKGE